MDHDHSHHDHDHSAHATDSPSAHHGHSMSFHFGSEELVLFDFWKTGSPLGIAISSLVIVILCFAMEGTRWLRAKRERAEKEAGGLSAPLSMSRVVDMALHGLQITLSYILMLVFMTFNVWLCIATVLGEVLARFVLTVFFPNGNSSVHLGCH